MIYKCNLCREIIHSLNTPGDDINDNFICPDCAKDVKETLDKVKKLRSAVHLLFANPN